MKKAVTISCLLFLLFGFGQVVDASYDNGGGLDYVRNSQNLGIHDTVAPEALTLNGYFALKEQASDDAPASGYGNLYAKADGLYYYNGSSAFWLTNGNITATSSSDIFVVNSNVISNNGSSADYQDDFVIGSPTLDGDGIHDVRMFFDKSKGAFRVGYANTTQWDEVNLGSYSVAWGYMTRATDVYSAAWGRGTIASADYSTAWGYQSTASGNYGTAWGYEAVASAVEATAWGYQTTASANRATAWGYKAAASGGDSTAWGYETVASADRSTAWGFQTTASGARSTAAGYWVTASAGDSITLGRGNSNSDRLINSQGESLVVGFNSNLATLFVGPSAGGSTTGNVGIATISPQEKLQVNGNILATGTINGTFLGNGAALTGIVASTATNANNADLLANQVPSYYLDNTDDQTLSFSSPNLSIGNGNTVDISAIDTNLTEREVENYIFDADSHTVNGAWSVKDDTNFAFGSDSDWGLQYDEDGAADQLLLATSKTSAAATTDPMFQILVGASPIANQQVFGVAKGTQGSNTDLFTLDEDGDASFNGTVTASSFSGDGSALTTLPSDVMSLDDLSDGVSNATNVYLGASAGSADTGTSYSTGVGINALLNNVSSSGLYNTAFGYKALQANTNGDDNTAIGLQALFQNTEGDYNIGIGTDVLRRNLTGNGNTAVGYHAGRGNSNDQVYAKNTLVGYRAGATFLTGANGNVLLGYQAGDEISTGAHNIVIGYDIDAPSAAASNQMTIGNLIFGTDVDGTSKAKSSGNIGIGDSSPEAKLKVNGTVLATAFSGNGSALTNLSGAAITTATAQQVLRMNSAGNIVGDSDLTFDGTTTSLKRVRGDDGSSGNPTFSFTAATTTGMYLTSSTKLTFSTSGGPIMYMTPGGNVGIGDSSADRKLEVAGEVWAHAGYLANGTESTVNSVAYGFWNDTNCGLHSPSSDNVSLVTGGVQRLLVTNSGSVGIAETSPLAKLHINGDVMIGSSGTVNYVSGEGDLYVKDVLEVDGVSFLSTIRSKDGSVSTPDYSFNGDTNMGMYRVSEDVIGFATGGVQRATISSSGFQFNGAVQVTEAIVFDAEVANGGVSGAVNIDWNDGNRQYIDLAGNVTSVTFTNPTGQRPMSCVLVIIQDASYTVSGWDSDIKWPGGTAPTITTGTNAVDVISCMYRYYDHGGGADHEYLCVPSQDFQ